MGAGVTVREPPMVRGTCHGDMFDSPLGEWLKCG